MFYYNIIARDARGRWSFAAGFQAVYSASRLRMIERNRASHGSQRCTSPTTRLTREP
jgi:hypothetical protein